MTDFFVKRSQPDALLEHGQTVCQAKQLGNSGAYCSRGNVHVPKPHMEDRTGVTNSIKSPP
jgi:hypothetical protein